MVSEKLHLEVCEYLDRVSSLVAKALDTDVHMSYLYKLPDKVVLRIEVLGCLFSTDYSPSWNPKSLAESILNNY